MTVETAQFASSSAPWQAVPALVVADGTVAHPAYRALLAPTAPLRDVIDAIHAICLQIGRASCRERECQYVLISVVAVSLKKKNTLDSFQRTLHTYTSSRSIQ